MRSPRIKADPPQETSQSAVELHGDDPDALELVLRQCYSLDPAALAVPGDPAAELARLAAVHVVADKYDAPDVRAAVAAQFAACAEAGWLAVWRAAGRRLEEVLEGAFAAPLPRSHPVRRAVAERTREHAERFRADDEPRFRALLERFAELAADVVMLQMTAHADFRATCVPTIPHKTGLHYAAETDNPDACVALLDAGLAVDFRDDNGETALHFSAWAGWLRPTRVLVERGADVNAVSFRYSRTPLHWARRADPVGREYRAVVAYLESVGAT